MTKEAISTDTTPAALGPYSQAIVAGGFVFCSGTASIDPATGVPGDGIEAQTELALRNLDAILTAAGTSLSGLVKTTIFYTNVEDFATINAIYARFMPDPRQPHRPHHRSQPRRLTRACRRTQDQPRRRPGQTRPDRPAHPHPHPSRTRNARPQPHPHPELNTPTSPDFKIIFLVQRMPMTGRRGRGVRSRRDTANGARPRSSIRSH